MKSKNAKKQEAYVRRQKELGRIPRKKYWTLTEHEKADDLVKKMREEELEQIATHPAMKIQPRETILVVRNAASIKDSELLVF